MDILIPDSWLRTYLKTKATSKEVAEYLSLCGPSVEKISKVGSEAVYQIEVTTNRIDSASVYGIAREAAAILPRFGVPSEIVKIPRVNNKHLQKNVPYLNAKIDNNLCFRFTAVLVNSVNLKPSPKWLQDRLKLVNVRPINNVVDISNYIMHELGQPVHTFDYDKIKGKKMILRESKKGENITTLDGKTHKLLGGDIVIEDGDGQLIDLAGIMGAQNSAVDDKTKNVLLFVQTYNPAAIRKTSMGLAHRTEAAELFEKGLDPLLVLSGIKRGIELFEKLKAGTPVAKILDIYPNPQKSKTVTTNLDYINSLLGKDLTLNEIGGILTSLNFTVFKKQQELTITPPSYRSKDIEIPEDIVEEIARIYGYHNLPSLIMDSAIPEALPDSPFDFENKVKYLLSGWGGVEVYTQSLASKNMIDTQAALKIRNPLGKEGEYLRTSLMPSLSEAAQNNRHFQKSFHLFELANIYLHQANDLPKESMILAGIFYDYKYRRSKGIIEALLDKLNIKNEYVLEEELGFIPSKHVLIMTGKKNIGQFGVLENELIYYEFNLELLRNLTINTNSYNPLPKYPPQIEDLTFNLPQKTRIGEVINDISNVTNISSVELGTIYNDAYTFTVRYQSSTKTLTDKEVKEIRKKVIELVEKKYGGVIN